MSERTLSIIMLALLAPVALSFSAVMLSEAFDWTGGAGAIAVGTSAPDPADAIRADADREQQTMMLQQVLTELNEYRQKAEQRMGFPVGAIVWAMVAMVGILTAAALGYALIRRRHPNHPAVPPGLAYPHHPSLPPAPPYYYDHNSGFYTDPRYQIEGNGQPIQRLNRGEHYPVATRR